MKATETKFLEFIKKSTQFVIPIYQRTYSWTIEECEQLLHDIIRVGEQEQAPTHFVGAIVYVEKGLSQISLQEPHLVIDGQQRLTTITLLLSALAETVGAEEPVDGFSAPKIYSRYLIDEQEKDERKYKLLLGETDKETLIAIVSRKEELPGNCSICISRNFNYFKKKIAEHKEKNASVSAICQGLAKLIVVDIALTRDQDNPQFIFESMNSTGLKLSETDLIRNFILMDLEHEEQTRLYKDYWRQMEKDFGQKYYTAHFDGFMRHYLTCKNESGEIPNKQKVYDAFKRHTREQQAKDDISSLVKDIKSYATYYCAIALGKEDDPNLKTALDDLRELKADVSYPFLLELYHDYKNGILDKRDLIEAIRMIESYVFRRVVCGLPPGPVNKVFAGFKKFLKKDHRYLESIKARFLNLSASLKFPRDEDFEKNIKIRDLYNFRSKNYWLRRFENFGRKEKIAFSDFTVEHIMPQKLSEKWEEMLGADWERIHETWLHTLGNLTLTGCNQEYGNKPFAEKRDMEGGFKTSPLKLNQGLGGVEIWDKEAIEKRGNVLVQEALKVWPAPALSSEIMNDYKSHNKANRSIEDYTFSSTTKELFNTLQEQIISLGPYVTKNLLKMYISYKAEGSSFVAIKPQRSGLKIYLNMRFADIDDPQNLCRDVSGMGHWGTGDIEMHFTNIGQLPDIMGLIRQSLDFQLHNEEIL